MPRNRRTRRGPVHQRVYEADLPNEKCARTGVLSEAGEVVESDDDQGNDCGEQLDRDECAQRGAVDLGEAGGDCGGRPLLAGIRQPPVALLEPPMDVLPFSACAHYVGELLERPAHTFTPRRGSTSCGAATLAPGENPPGISFVDDPRSTVHADNSRVPRSSCAEPGVTERPRTRPLFNGSRCSGLPGHRGSAVIFGEGLDRSDSGYVGDSYLIFPLGLVTRFVNGFVNETPGQ